MKLGVLLALPLLLFAGRAGAAVPSSDAAALALLQRAADSPRHISFVGQVELLTIGSHGSQASIFHVEHRAPDLTRRWYISPPDLYGDWEVARGNTTYAVDVTRRRIVVTHNEAFGVHYGWRHDLTLLQHNYSAVLGPPAEVTGHRAQTVSLVNRYTGATTMRLWIDAATGLMLQRQVFSTNGALVVQMHFDDVRFTNDIPASTFSLPRNYATVAGPSRGVPSTDPARVMAQAGFAAREPRYLPEGFVPIAADLADENGVRTLHLLYSDGLRTVSLFENARGAAVDMSGYRPVPVTDGALRGEAVEEGPTTLLAWSQGNLHFALVGDLNREELEKIARSLV